MCAYLAIFLVFLLFVASAARPWRPDAVVQREGLDCDCLALRSFQSLFSLCHLLNAVWRPASILHLGLVRKLDLGRRRICFESITDLPINNRALYGSV